VKIRKGEKISQHVEVDKARHGLGIKRKKEEIQKESEGRILWDTNQKGQSERAMK